jgi:hypothetical protein
VTIPLTQRIALYKLIGGQFNFGLGYCYLNVILFPTITKILVSGPAVCPPHLWDPNRRSASLSCLGSGHRDVPPPEVIEN